MTRDEFLLRRQSGIGGSDIGAICGVSPWKSPLDVYRDKVAEPESIINNEAFPVGETKSLYWGSVHETEKIIAADDKKNIVKELDIVKNNAILNNIGCGSPVYEAGVVSVNGGELLNKPFTVSFFEPAGRTLCGVTSYTSSTPAGSFFVPDVEVRGKILAQNPYTKKVCS